MKIQFIDTNYEVCINLQQLFSDIKDINVYNTDIFEYPTDCIATAGNSFGIMTGGIDLVVREHFGKQIEDCVKTKIQTDYAADLLVGQSFILDTEDLDIPYLLYAPTMRVPSDISETINVYLAMKSILLTASKHDDIEILSIPGLGTLTGGMHAFTAAHQMRTAYDDFINGFKLPGSLAKARMNQDYLISRSRF
jgi:O-acetyl-ADP-ribose deacetylase (regulator of RNase III)